MSNMEELMFRICNRLADGMPLLAEVDEDCGQLRVENPAGDAPVYGVNFPCALVDAGTAQWSGAPGAALFGETTVTVSLAFDCAGIPEADRAGRRAVRGAMFDTLCGRLHGWRPEGAAPMRLAQERSYALRGEIRVYEAQFRVKLTRIVSAQ